MRKTTLWSSLGAAVLLAASSFSASAANYKVNFLSPSPDAAEVSSEEMKKIVFQYESAFTAGQISTLWGFVSAEAFEAGVTLVDQNGTPYPLLGYALAQKDGTIVLGNDSPESQDLLTSSDKNQVAVTFGDLPAGTYTLTIAEKIVKSGSYSFMASANDGSGEHTWTVTGGTVTPSNPWETYAFEPESGSTIAVPESGYMTIKLSFPEAGENMLQGPSDDTDASQITLSDGTNTFSPINRGATQADFKSVLYSFETAGLVSGTYELTVPAGFYKTSDGQPTPAITGTFVIEAPEVNPLEVYALDPASGSRVDVPRFAWAGYTFEVSFPEIGDNTLEAIDESAFANVYLTNGTDNINAYSGEMSSDNKSFEVGFASGIVGNYTLVVPAGFCKTANGDLSPEIRGEYTFVAPLPEFESQDPAYNVENPSISEMRLNYSAAVEFKADAAPMAVLNYETDADTGMTATFSALENEGKTVVVKFSETALEDGEYYFMVPEGAIYAAGDPEAVLGQETYTFLIKAPVKPAYDGQYPAEGEGVVGLTEVKQFFTAPVAIAEGAATEFTLYNNTAYENNEDDYINGTANVTLSEDGLTAIFTLNPVKELVAADYKVIVPKGVFVSATDPSYQLGALLLRFTVAPAPVNPMTIFTVDPADNSEVTEIDEIILDFTELDPNVGAEMNSSCLEKSTITNVTTGQTWNTSNNSTSGNYAKRTIKPIDENAQALTLTDAGEYVLTIPAEAMYDYSTKNNAVRTYNEEIVLHYTIAGTSVNPMTIFTVDPADNSEVTEIDEVVIDFTELNPNDGAELSNFEDCPEKATLKNETTGETWSVVNNNTLGNYAKRTLYFVDETGTKVTLTEAGEYVLTLPARYMYDYSTRNNAEKTFSEEIVLHYTIPEPPANPFAEYGVMPEDQVVREISTVTLSFFGYNFGTVVDMNSEKKAVLVNKETNEEYVANVAFDEFFGNVDYNTVKLTFDPAITVLGDYTLTVEAGLLSLNGVESLEITKDFTVAEIPSAFSGWTLDPAPGKEVSSLEKLTLTFPNVGSSVLDVYMGDITLTLKGTETVITPSMVAKAYDPVAEEDINGVFEITFDPAVTAAGTYVLNIPSGKFMNWSDGDDVCPEINVEYVIAANPFGTYTLTPASMEEGLKEVSTVEVLFPAISAEETITYDEADVEKIGMRNVDTDQVIPAIAIEQTDTENGKLLTIRFAKAATDAKHILTIPAGILKLGDATNFMIEAIYDIEASGVALLVGENGTADVYDLNGRVILLNADADALRQLEGGLYIINGKKVVIRK